MPAVSHCVESSRFNTVDVSIWNAYVSQKKICYVRFEQLFVDIGDEQSIENDLSTYSSTFIKYVIFLSHANAKTLVLMDEMGMVTDPAFLGGLMAEAVLEKLHQKNIFGIITTHF